MKKTTKLTLKYFWEHTKPYKWFVLLTTIGVISAISAFGTFLPLIVKTLFDTIINSTDKTQLMGEINLLFIYLLLVYLVGNVGWRITEFTLTHWESSIMRNIENDSFKKLQKHSFNFFANNFSGALVTKTNRLTRSYERMMDTIVFEILVIITKLVGGIIVLSIFSKTLSLILIIWTIGYMILSSVLYNWKFKYDIIAANKDSRVTAELADSITNILNTKIFARRKFEHGRFKKTTEDRYKSRKKSWNIGNYINLIQGIVMAIGEIGMLYIAINLWYKEMISIGTIILLQMYLYIIMFSIFSFGRSIKNIFESLADSEEMIEIIHQDEDLKDIENPEKCKIKNGLIKFNNVNFQYDNKKIFTNFNMNINAKQSIGLVGESGAGKSTITKLLLRFVDIDSGSIEIDKQNIAKITQDNLRENISYVPQDPILFHRSLYENIAYSKPNATEKEIYNAAKKANIHAFIMSLPDKYNTMVGERGIKLSGGERQRVTIARAMLKNSPIIILDEATSALDSKSEKLIQKAIENLTKNKTTIIIAHRLSTIKMVDKIIVLDKGKIKESGTHTQLIKKKGKYHELWEHQTSNI